MLGRAGTYHICLFFFSPIPIYPLGMGLSTFGLLHYYILHRHRPQDEPHSQPYWDECSLIPRLALLEHAEPCRRWGFMGGLRSVKVL